MELVLSIISISTDRLNYSREIRDVGNIDLKSKYGLN
jgi:hypothetical protein